MNTYYQTSIINRYKYSGISEEGKILTNKFLKATNYNFKNLTKQIISYPDNKLAILTKVLSNHNSLNYHMTRANLGYDETAQHIICKCSYLNI